jgi:hypothetical protein
MPGERPSFTLPVEPISPPPKPARRDRPRAAGFGGGAGYRPRVRVAYFDAVYRHSRTKRQIEYKACEAFFKLDWEGAAALPRRGVGDATTAHGLARRLTQSQENER